MPRRKTVLLFLISFCVHIVNAVKRTCSEPRGSETRQNADNAFKQTAINYKTRKHYAMIAYHFVKWFGKGND